MDLSDGLADAVRQVADASGVGIEIDAEALPIDAAARDWFVSRGQDPVLAAAAGGDDYELLFTVSRRARRRLDTVRRQARGVVLTRIGTVTAVPGARLRRNGVSEPMPKGFVHF
jgi:thiamine-monophosphate kinase